MGLLLTKSYIFFAPHLPLRPLRVMLLFIVISKCFELQGDMLKRAAIGRMQA